MFSLHGSTRNRLRFPAFTKFGFYTPPAPWNYEQYLNGVKGKLLTQLQASPVLYSRLPSEMRQALRLLRQDDSIIIKPADKHLGTAIVSTKWYLQETQRQLCNPNVYKRLTSPISAITTGYAHLRRLLRLSGNLFLPDQPSRQLTPLAKYFLQDERLVNSKSTSRISQFYLIVKLHKTPVAGRPIVSTCASMTAAAARWVDHQLQPVMQRQRSYLMDSSALLVTLEATTLPPDVVLLTADVESLYPSINLNHALHRIRLLLINDQDWGANKRTWFLLNVMRWVLFNNVFSFGDTSWLQLRGTAMGSPLAVVFANLYLSCLESDLLNTLETPPLLYKRFIDDIFVVLPPESAGVEDFMTKFNGLHDTINLTFETGNSIPFLDLQIFKGPRFHQSGILDVSLHQKVLNSYLYIVPTSLHPAHVFPAFIKSELQRACRNTSDVKQFWDFKQLFYLRLRRRGYAPTFLKPVFNSVHHSTRNKLLERLTARGQLSSTKVNETPLILKLTNEPRTRRMNIASALRIPENLQHDQFFNLIFNGRQPLTCWRTGYNFSKLLCPSTFRHPVSNSWDPGPPLP
jgi:hypothetical protein